MRVYSTVDPAKLSQGTFCAIFIDCRDKWLPLMGWELRIYTPKEVITEKLPVTCGGVVEKRRFVSPNDPFDLSPIELYRNGALIDRWESVEWPTRTA